MHFSVLRKLETFFSFYKHVFLSQKQTLLPFRTAVPTDDLDSFIVRFKDYATLKDFNAAKSVLALNTRISGHARVFLQSIPDAEKNSLEKIHDLLKTNFEAPSWRWGYRITVINTLTTTV